MNVYVNTNLEYSLLETEYEIIDDVFHFINLFDFLNITLSEHRTNVINNVTKNNISENDFFIYEKIAEKLLWNLKKRTQFLYPELANCVTCTYDLTHDGLTSVLNKFYDDNSYRSFVNKLVLIDDINKKVHHRMMEGSAPIFSKNEFNLRLWVSLRDRKIYEEIMNNPIKITKIIIPEYYFNSDYALPNLNFGKPFIQSNEFRKERIKKMYYRGDTNECQKNWFKLLKKN